MFIAITPIDTKKAYMSVLLGRLGPLVNKLRSFGSFSFFKTKYNMNIAANCPSDIAISVGAPSFDIRAVLIAKINCDAEVTAATRPSCSNLWRPLRKPDIVATGIEKISNKQTGNKKIGAIWIMFMRKGDKHKNTTIKITKNRIREDWRLSTAFVGSSSLCFVYAIASATIELRKDDICVSRVRLTVTSTNCASGSTLESIGYVI
jgi:hypothetical protein